VIDAFKRIARRTAIQSGFADLCLRYKQNQPLILMYHGVTSNSSPEAPHQAMANLHLPKDTFAAQLRTLCKYRRVIALEEMVQGLIDKRPPLNTVAITFDDGYENNFTSAAPVLIDYKCHATFFVTTGHIGEKKWPWTDRLTYAMESTRVPELQVAELNETFRLDTFECKRTALRKIKEAIKSQAVVDAHGFVAGIAERLGVAHVEPYGDYRFMDWQQLKNLAAEGFSIGAHTVNHPILSHISLERAKAEILDSKNKIAAELGACNPIFCYPNGKASDFSPELTAFCRLHFKAALSTIVGAASLEDLYSLKRVSLVGGTSEQEVEWSLLRNR
jgi:peptidoglycan/xylan/chitin deacetylase (PgdA/CDA1 family)